MLSPIVDFRTKEKAFEGREQTEVLGSIDPNKVKIYLKGLPKKATRADILATFSEFGSLSYIKLPFSAKSGRNMGYGYIVFSNQLDGIHLVENVRSVRVMKKSVEVSYKLPKPRGSKDVPGTGDVRLNETESNCDTTHAIISNPPSVELDRKKDLPKTRPLEQIEISFHQLKPISSEYHRLRLARGFSLGHIFSNLCFKIKRP